MRLVKNTRRLLIIVQLGVGRKRFLPVLSYPVLFPAPVIETRASDKRA